jgi:hypothetical protein
VRQLQTSRHGPVVASKKNTSRMSGKAIPATNPIMTRIKLILAATGISSTGIEPGLAKKHNGCMPPGQAKKWVIGRPLPRDVIFYDLPPAVAINIGPPPIGYRFVRVASDILMISIGTGMVIDAINDLGRY